jgi:hypothetical protein
MEWASFYATPSGPAPGKKTNKVLIQNNHLFCFKTFFTFEGYESKTITKRNRTTNYGAKKT